MERVGTITRKGQVTIPIDIRRALGLQEGDTVSFVLDGGIARLIPRGDVVQRTAGIFRTEGPPPTAEELRAAAEIAIAEDTVRRSGA